MTRRRPYRIRHKFVEAIPDQVEEEVLYVSIARRIAVHRCLCGCGQEVATPLAPHEWQVLFDGESVSLLPSVGVWGMPCRSHYWIRRDRVIWSKRISTAKIEELRRREHLEAEGLHLEGHGDETRTAFWRRVHRGGNSRRRS